MYETTGWLITVGICQAVMLLPVPQRHTRLPRVVPAAGSLERSSQPSHAQSTETVNIIVNAMESEPISTINHHQHFFHRVEIKPEIRSNTYAYTCYGYMYSQNPGL